MSIPLLTFKAGRSFRRSSTNFVDPDHTKGVVQIARDDEDMLHFQWRSRTGQIHEDLIIIPTDAEFVKASSRTYVLKFSSSSQRHFFWMQDLSPQNDEVLAAHVNGYLSDPDYQQSSYVPVTQSPEASPPATGQAFSAAQLEQLRALVSQVSDTQQAATGLPELSLSDVLTPSNLRPLFDQPNLLRAVFPHLPSDLPIGEHPSEDTITRIIESPQFQAGIRNLDQALSTGLMGGFVKGLGLPEEAGLAVGPFLKAIAEQAQRESSRAEDESSTMETD